MIKVIGSQATSNTPDAELSFKFQAFTTSEIGEEFSDVEVIVAGTQREINRFLKEFQKARAEVNKAKKANKLNSIFDKFNNTDRYSAKRIACAEKVEITKYNQDGTRRRMIYE